MKQKSKLYAFPSIDIVSESILKGFENLKEKIDFDVTKKQLVSEFKFDYYEEKLDWCGGYFDFGEKELVVSINEDFLYKETTFCHEFGHLLQYMFNFSEDLYHSKTISDILKKEQEAEVLGIKVWNWLYPKQEFPGIKNKEFLPYFDIYGINYIVDINKNYIENDLQLIF